MKNMVMAVLDFLAFSLWVDAFWCWVYASITVGLIRASVAVDLGLSGLFFIGLVLMWTVWNIAALCRRVMERTAHHE